MPLLHLFLPRTRLNPGKRDLSVAAPSLTELNINAFSRDEADVQHEVRAGKTFKQAVQRSMHDR